MVSHWHLVANNNNLEEVRRNFEKVRIYEDLEDHTLQRIPKISQRPYYKKNSDFINNAKKTVSKSQESLLDIDEQVKSSQRILDLQNKLGVTIIQKNGQRKLGPPPNRTGPPPGPGCEVFVGRIPRNIYEDVIYPIFRNIGEIYELRLMMNFSGTNRGFCFIMYEKPEHAQKAIELLNDYQIQPGWYIGVVESVNNCRLHATHLPPDTDAKYFIEKIWSLCEEVDTISVFTNICNHGIKHALITYKTHRGAAMARRRLLPERNNLFDKHEIRIEWAHPDITVKNVIEEKGFCDQGGNIIITSKVIKNDKKTFCAENANKALFKLAQKKDLLNSFKPRCGNVMKHQQKETDQYNRVLGTKHYSNRDVNNNKCLPNINKSKINNYYNNRKDKFNNNNFKNLNDFNYSITRSDESLSSFSKSSESDDFKNIIYQNCDKTYCNTVPLVIPPYLNTGNCSHVRYPWSESVPVKRTYTTFNNTPFPWRNVNFNNIDLPVHGQTSFIEQIPLNTAGTFYGNNNNFLYANGNGNSMERFEPHYQNMYYSRPILNRNV